MSSCVKKNTLNNYLQKLKNIGKMDLGEKVATMLAKKGAEYARTEYDSTNISKVTIESDVNGSKATVSASKKGLTYIEYGTGLVGQDTYQGKLPTSGVPITGHWEYFYDSPHKDIERGGWWIRKGISFTRGREAGMQMYNTAKSLDEYVKDGELAKDLKEEIRK